MKQAAAPLVLRSRDLARWVLERGCGNDRLRALGLADALGGQATRLAISLHCALSFPRGRRRHQRAADEAIVALRTLGELATELGGLTAAQRRYLDGELVELGRMLGGWMRAARDRSRSSRSAIESGVAAQAAPNG